MALLPQLAAPPSASRNERSIAALKTLTDKLSWTLTCAICMEHMEKARQLQCGHVFCASCVVRILRMRKVRCALCKQKTSKRMVRSPTLPFHQLIKSLNILQTLVQPYDNPSSSILLPVTSSLSTSTPSMFRSQLDAHQRLIQFQQLQLSQHKKLQINNQQIQTQQQQRNNHICILCPRKNITCSHCDFGKWMQLSSNSLNTSTTNEPRYVHENCALFSDDVYAIDENVVDNVEGILNLKKTCQSCLETTAHVKCFAVDCNQYYHYVCAVRDGCVLVNDGYRMFCADHHKDDAPNIDDGQFIQALSVQNEDISKHDDFCFVCSTGGRLLMCDTCVRSSHPACSALKSIPIGEWRCAFCTGKSHMNTYSTSKEMHILKTPTNNSRRNIESIGVVTGGNKSVKRARTLNNNNNNNNSNNNNNNNVNELVFLDHVTYNNNNNLVSASVDNNNINTVSNITPLSSSMAIAAGTSSSSSKRYRRSSDTFNTPSSSSKRMTVMTTGLDEQQKEEFITFAKLHRVTVKSEMEDRVSHIIIGASSNAHKATRTMKLCQAVARKLPVISWSWVTSSTTSNTLSPILEHVHAVTRTENVFQGKYISLSTFTGEKKLKEELVQLLKSGGAHVVSRYGQHVCMHDVIFIKNDDASSSAKKNTTASGRSAKSRFDPPPGATVVPYTWILDQIAQR